MIPFIEYMTFLISYSSSSIRLISSTYCWDVIGSMSALSSLSISCTNDVPESSLISISVTANFRVDQTSLKSESHILPVKLWPLRLFLAIRMVSIQADREVSPVVGLFPHPLPCGGIPAMFLSRVYSNDISKSLLDNTVGVGPLGKRMAFCCLLRWHPVSRHLCKLSVDCRFDSGMYLSRT